MLVHSRKPAGLAGETQTQEGDPMNVDRIVHIFAGSMILASLALAKLHSPNWLWLTAFVGLNLLQSGLTNWCLMTSILRKLGVPEGPAVGCKR